MCSVVFLGSTHGIVVFIFEWGLITREDFLRGGVGLFFHAWSLKNSYRILKSMLRLVACVGCAGGTVLWVTVRKGTL